LLAVMIGRCSSAIVTPMRIAGALFRRRRNGDYGVNSAGAACRMACRSADGQG